MEFAKLNIMPEILLALKEEAYINPTDIQSQAIQLILQGNRKNCSLRTPHPTKY